MLGLKDERAEPRFQLALSYPRKVFVEEDFQKTFAELGLTPSATILVLQVFILLSLTVLRTAIAKIAGW